MTGSPKKFRVEVRYYSEKEDCFIWSAVRPGGGEPYEWDTHEEAWRTAYKIMYPLESDNPNIRIVEI
jgi:hypothetical protein